MELRQLRYLAAVAREGTFTAAAAALSVAQPALWRQVRDLERELGIPVFERVGRRVRLTVNGTEVLGKVATALEHLERLEETATLLRTAQAGVVAIACASPHLPRFLAPVIGQFRRAHPAVTFRIREYGGGSAPGRGIPQDLFGGIVDLATGVVPADDVRVDGFPIYAVRLVLAVPDDHPWRDRTTVDVALLRDQAVVASQPGSYSRGALKEACRRAGFEPLVALDSASPMGVLALGAAGLGIPVTIDDAVPNPPGRPWPVLVLEGSPISDRVGLAWRAGAQLSPAVSEFVELARQAADQDQLATSA